MRLYGLDALLIDVAQRIQLSPTKHDEAQRRFIALCEYIDRPDSPLHGLIAECYGGGSFSTGTVIASKVSKNQHDVDAIIEARVSPDEEGARVKPQPGLPLPPSSLRTFGTFMETRARVEVSTLSTSGAARKPRGTVNLVNLPLGEILQHPFCGLALWMEPQLSRVAPHHHRP